MSTEATTDRPGPERPRAATRPAEEWRRPAGRGRGASADRFRRTSDRAFLGLVAELRRAQRTR